MEHYTDETPRITVDLVEKGLVPGRTSGILPHSRRSAEPIFNSSHDTPPEDSHPGTYRSPIRGSYIREAYDAPHRLREPRRRSWRETLLMQCTVCGILLAAVLFMNVADTRATNGAMAWLRLTLTEDSSTAGRAISSIWDTVRGVFADGEPAVPNTLPVGTNAPTNTAAPKDPTQTTGIGEPAFDPAQINADRIDEDILDSIVNAPELYNQKN